MRTSSPSPTVIAARLDGTMGNDDNDDDGDDDDDDIDYDDDRRR